MNALNARTNWVWSVIVLTFLHFSPKAEAQPETPCGLMVMAHGGKETWNTSVEAAVAPIREEIPTTVAFGMANPITLAAAVTELEEQGVDCIAVVRLFVSSQSFLHQTEYLLGLRQDPPPIFVMMPGHGSGHNHDPEPVHVFSALEISREGLLDAPQMGSILAERALALRDSLRQESVIVIAHGPGDDQENEMWLSRLDALADSIRVTGHFAEVEVHTLREDWKEKRSSAEDGIRDFVKGQHDMGKAVIVIPFRLFGFGPYADVLDGLTYESSGEGLLPSPHVTDWIKLQYHKTVNKLVNNMLGDRADTNW